MTMRKIAVSLPAELVEQAKAAVSAGRAGSVSSYVAQALHAHADSVTLSELLDQWDGELGPVSAEVQEWADRVLDRSDS